MEHRFGPRQQIRLRVKVYLDHLPTLAAYTRDVSGQGLNLPLTHPALARNRIVRIALTEGDAEEIWQTWALVVHASEESGTGLVLEESLPPEAYAREGAGVPEAASPI